MTPWPLSNPIAIVSLGDDDRRVGHDPTRLATDLVQRGLRIGPERPRRADEVEGRGRRGLPDERSTEELGSVAVVEQPHRTRRVDDRVPSEGLAVDACDRGRRAVSSIASDRALKGDERLACRRHRRSGRRPRAARSSLRARSWVARTASDSSRRISCEGCASSDDMSFITSCPSGSASSELYGRSRGSSRDATNSRSGDKRWHHRPWVTYRSPLACARTPPGHHGPGR